MYPIALASGVPALQFWDLTLQELLDITTGHNKEQEYKARREATNLFALADIISNRMGYLFTEPNKRSDDMLLRPWDYFPGLFEEEQRHAATEREEAAFENYKASRMKFIERWNQKFKEADNGPRENENRN